MRRLIAAVGVLSVLALAAGGYFVWRTYFSNPG